MSIPLANPSDEAPRFETYDEIVSGLFTEPIWNSGTHRALRAGLTLNGIRKQDPDCLPYREGMWAWLSTKGEHCAYANVVLHWPLIVNRITKCVQYPKRQAEPYFAALSARLTEIGKDDAAQKALQDTFTRRVMCQLPSGIVQPMHPDLHAVFSEKKKKEKNQYIRDHYDDITVIRLGALTKYVVRALQSTFTHFSPIAAQSLRLIDPRLLGHLPLAARLLYFVLTEAEQAVPGEGWSDWGLLWTRTQLFFNYRVALEHVYNGRQLPPYFEGLSKDIFIAHIRDTPYEAEAIRYKGIPAFSRVYTVAKVDVERHQEYFSKMAWVSREAPSQYPAIPRQDHNNYLIFRTDGDNSVINYFSGLRDMPSTMVDWHVTARPPHVVKMPKNLRKEFSIARETGRDIKPEEMRFALGRRAKQPSTKAVLPQADPATFVYEPRLEFTVNAFDLNFALPEPEKILGMATVDYAPCTISSLVYRGKYYLSLPLQFMAHFPALFSQEHALFNEQEEIRADALVVRDRILHLNWSLLAESGGIFWRKVFGHVKTAGPEHISYLQAAARLYSWLANPDRKLMQPIVGPEFWSGTDLYPDKLQTDVDRIEFFRSKAKAQKRYQIGELGPKKGRRSARLSNYDRFVLWYVLGEEINGMRFHADQMTSAMYITQRWLPWRTVEANFAAIQIPPLYRDAKDTCFVAKDAAALHRQVDKGPPAFSRAAPRTGQLVAGSNYIYREDVLNLVMLPRQTHAHP